MNIFSSQHEYKFGSDSQMDKYFVSLKQFVKYLKGTEPKYYYFQQKELNDGDVSNWRFAVTFTVNGKRVNILQPTGKDWQNKFKFRVDGSEWKEGNKVATVEDIESITSSRRAINSSKTALEMFQTVKDVCTEYGIEVPQKIMDPFYQDLVLALIPDFLGETEMRRRQDRINKYEEDMRKYGYSEEGKYRFASRQIKNSISKSSNTYKKAKEIVKKLKSLKGRDSVLFDKMRRTTTQLSDSDEQKLIGIIKEMYPNVADYECKRIRDAITDVMLDMKLVKNSRKINNSKSYDELVRIALDSGDVLDIQENGDVETWYCSNKKEANTQADIINANCGNKSVCYNFRKGNGCYKFDVYKSMIENSRKIESAKEEDCGADACVLTPFGEIDRTVANADFTDESFEAYVVEPYAEESDGMFITELETKGE